MTRASGFRFCFSPLRWGDFCPQSHRRVADVSVPIDERSPDRLASGESWEICHRRRRHRVHRGNRGGGAWPQNLRMRRNLFGRSCSRLPRDHRFHSQPGRAAGDPGRSCRSEGIERCAVEELQAAGRGRRGARPETLGGAIGKRDPRSATGLVDPDRDVHERYPRHDRGLAQCGASQRGCRFRYLRNSRSAWLSDPPVPQPAREPPQRQLWRRFERPHALRSRSYRGGAGRVAARSAAVFPLLRDRRPGRSMEHRRHHRIVARITRSRRGRHYLFIGWNQRTDQHGGCSAASWLSCRLFGSRASRSRHQDRCRRTDHGSASRRADSARRTGRSDRACTRASLQSALACSCCQGIGH